MVRARIITGMNTGELLQAWRNSLGWTQEEMAGAMGVGRSYVSDAEANRSSPTVARLLRFIAAIEVERQQSLGDDERERLARFFLGPLLQAVVVGPDLRLLGGKMPTAKPRARGRSADERRR